MSHVASPIIGYCTKWSAKTKTRKQNEEKMEPACNVIWIAYVHYFGPSFLAPVVQILAQTFGLLRYLVYRARSLRVGGQMTVVNNDNRYLSPTLWKLRIRGIAPEI